VRKKTPFVDGVREETLGVVSSRTVLSWYISKYLNLESI